MKIYTKTGDQGETSLLSGGRVAKDHLRIAAYGTLDELNSVIGVLLAEEAPPDARARLEEVQHSLFALGAVLADAEGRHIADISAWDPKPLEDWIDDMENELPILKNFILPGGTKSSALAHLARTVCRRAEREVVAVGRDAGDLPAGVLEYLNRLSDGFFVLARWLNHTAGVSDRLWRPNEA